MQIQKLIVALAGMAVVADASVTFLDTPLSAALAKRQNRGGNNNNNNNNNNNGGNNGGNNGQLCLNANNVQKGSDQAGTPKQGQANSKTDPANFINICSNKQLTNGEQKTAGSCNGIPMGIIPAQNNMVSTIIKNPPNGGNIQANQQFNVQLKVANLQAGSFTDAQSTYYSAPQELNGQGNIIGHVHVTIQDMGNSLNPQNPLDAKQFVFFKGIDDAGDGQGNLQAVVTGGLPAGNYRVCTMSSASNHQPVLMPVAQRGAQDDCNKFTVGGGGGGGNNNNNNNGGGNNNGQNNGGNNGGNNGQNKGGNNGGKQQKGASTGGNPDLSNQSSPGNTGTGSGAQSGQTGNANTKTQGGGGASNSGSGKGGATANAIGGIQAPAVQNSGDSSRPFSVNGNTFVNKAAAVQRACDIQRNGCFDAINRKQVTSASTSDCDSQFSTCTQQLS
ncbi:hypothetical protein LX32DRAFT_195800 [Colletotrichum zoysiae]|uniref:Ribosomal protein s17 n=1 Tax=Colletotrichum zoysiae TaxID=1216348 RepID=A0AAD9H4U8_9PEZI|nr:hypothetical protein LX32DRAFT_195800 [Colletotrichum zoysiae]